MTKKISVLLIFIISLVLISPACSGSSNSLPAPSQALIADVEGEISFEKNFYLIIDDSDSMSSEDYAGSFPERIQAAKWAVEEFVTKAVPQDVNLGLYALNSGKELVPLGKNRELIIEKIRKLNHSNGTPLNNAIQDGTDALVKQREKQLGYGEFYLVVATDGEATDNPSDASRGVTYASKNNIPIITIGFGIKNHPLKNQSLSYREATSPAELLQALKETQGESEYFDTSTFNK